MSEYGNVSEIWFVSERGKELKYPPNAAFTTLHAARNWAIEHCTRSTDFSIYRAQLHGNVLIDEPRWVPEAQPNDSTGGNNV